jgi:hypothetical protein
VVPAPYPAVDGFDLVFAVGTDDVVLFDDSGVPAAALRGLLRVRHDASSFREAARDVAGGRPAVVSGGELGHSSRRWATACGRAA